MKELSVELQQRVWQRVRGGQMPPLEGEMGVQWQQLAEENARAYGHLAQVTQGKHGAALRGLERDCREMAASLRGLARLRGERHRLPQGKADWTGADAILEQCCHRERRLWEGLEPRSRDPEWGPVYALLARRAAQRWIKVLELLGRM